MGRRYEECRGRNIGVAEAAQLELFHVKRPGIIETGEDWLCTIRENAFHVKQFSTNDMSAIVE